MTYQPTVIVLSTLALILLIPPFAWHLKCKNVSAIILIFWLFIINLKSVVDISIWGTPNFASGWEGYGWCDIMIKFVIGANVGIPCCIARIIYQLTEILKADHLLPDKSSWKYICKDILLVLTNSIISMGLSYLVQVSRYGIVEYSGCQNILSATWVTLVVYSLWGFLWSFLGFILALRLMFIFHRKRKDVSDILHCTNSGLNLARFARLLIFCLVIILIMFPITLYGFIETCLTITGKYSFKETHLRATWFIIYKIPQSKPLYSIWIFQLMAYLNFLIFGLGSDAINLYLKFFYSIGFKPIIDKYRSWKLNRKMWKKQKLVGEFLATNVEQHLDISISDSQENSELSLAKILNDSKFTRKHSASTPIYDLELNDENYTEEQETFITDYTVSDRNVTKSEVDPGFGTYELNDLFTRSTTNNWSRTSSNSGSSNSNNDNNNYKGERSSKGWPLTHLYRFGSKSGNENIEITSANSENDDSPLTERRMANLPELNPKRDNQINEVNFHYKIQRK
ncbi:Ste3p SCDLUD_003957 [Saccharomycodes ludwigii]|uniref:Ste3p n=1 Tax=Saccharomycodes ludwigii TaxID=36035 RepID=UPI001E88A775|nr:hypothetical protein SCDLUD_003957 [Saccharomycodes ludwigii]KAH3899674.1 hypothetical protein SCDLUD_003957 [Saccharomycodes ludwigii]